MNKNKRKRHPTFDSTISGSPSSSDTNDDIIPSGLSYLKPLLHPLRDLTDNWNVDISKYLDHYIHDIESTDIDEETSFFQFQTIPSSSYNDNEYRNKITAQRKAKRLASFNFVQAALVLQGSSIIYSKKVEYFQSLVQQFIHNNNYYAISNKDNDISTDLNLPKNDATKSMVPPEVSKLKKNILKYEKDYFGNFEVGNEHFTYSDLPERPLLPIEFNTMFDTNHSKRDSQQGKIDIASDKILFNGIHYPPYLTKVKSTLHKRTVLSSSATNHIDEIVDNYATSVLSMAVTHPTIEKSFNDVVVRKQSKNSKKKKGLNKEAAQYASSNDDTDLESLRHPSEEISLSLGNKMVNIVGRILKFANYHPSSPPGMKPNNFSYSSSPIIMATNTPVVSLEYSFDKIGTSTDLILLKKKRVRRLAAKWLKLVDDISRVNPEMATYDNDEDTSNSSSHPHHVKGLHVSRSFVDLDSGLAGSVLHETAAMTEVLSALHRLVSAGAADPKSGGSKNQHLSPPSSLNFHLNRDDLICDDSENENFDENMPDVEQVFGRIPLKINGPSSPLVISSPVAEDEDCNYDSGVVVEDGSIIGSTLGGESFSLSPSKVNNIEPAAVAIEKEDSGAVTTNIYDRIESTLESVVRKSRRSSYRRRTKLQDQNIKTELLKVVKKSTEIPNSTDNTRQMENSLLPTPEEFVASEEQLTREGEAGFEIINPDDFNRVFIDEEDHQGDDENIDIDDAIFHNSELGKRCQSYLEMATHHPTIANVIDKNSRYEEWEHFIKTQVLLKTTTTNTPFSHQIGSSKRSLVNNKNDPYDIRTDQDSILESLQSLTTCNSSISFHPFTECIKFISQRNHRACNMEELEDTTLIVSDCPQMSLIRPQISPNSSANFKITTTNSEIKYLNSLVPRAFFATLVLASSGKIEIASSPTISNTSSLSQKSINFEGFSLGLKNRISTSPLTSPVKRKNR